MGMSRDNNTMPPLDLTRRRCAAFMALSEVLKGEQLMRAMWMLEKRDKSIDKMAFIGYVGIAAELLGINNIIIATTLYPKLTRNLDLPNQDLADDPMPQMLEFRDNRKVNKQTETNRGNVTSTKKIDSTRGKTKGTPEMHVFAVLISRIVSEAGYPEAESYYIFNEVFKEEIEKAKLHEDNHKQIIVWVDTLSIKSFKRNIVAEELSAIVHCVYIALCEALGPVKTDKILNQAIRYSSKLPAAKIFSPKNFL